MDKTAVTGATAGRPHAYPFAGSYEGCPGLGLDPKYARLRENEPAARVLTPEGDLAVLVTRYDDACRVLARPAEFSREHVNVAGDALRDGMRDEAFLTEIEGERHRAQRNLIEGYFTAAGAERLRVRARRVTDELVERMAAAVPPVDLVEALALPLPIAIICDVLGIPDDDQGQFSDWARAFLGLRSRSRGKDQEASEAAGAAMYHYMQIGLAEHRANPDDSLLTALAVAENPTVDEHTRILLAIGTLVAGFETTANTIAGQAYTLLYHYPDLWRQLAERPETIPSAVEELLRWIPVDARDGMARGATRDVVLAGSVLPEGSAVLVARGAANRDPRRFDDPERLDLRRRPNPHLAFGYGPHRCPGEHMARMALQVALTGLVSRFPDLRPAVSESALRWNRSTMRGLRSLPVTWGKRVSLPS
ncbi:cytochrome P450 [Actinomadura barringtoniae]|uniref:Cytochrome P450 n=1 Tax=Actinomadura barringtoniae TaxID=1427535 RepID=A0A939PE36_9ACTN|nr:cytochrome P450 [Actinomadura barringtoniae]MBO2450911.1 cytochrome P450 [Actinomadura barringtoniae]